MIQCACYHLIILNSTKEGGGGEGRGRGKQSGNWKHNHPQRHCPPSNQTLTSHSGRHLIDKTAPTERRRKKKGHGQNLIDQCHEPVNEIVAEPEFTIQTSKSQFVFPPADGEILTGQVKVASSLNYLPPGETISANKK